MVAIGEGCLSTIRRPIRIDSFGTKTLMNLDPESMRSMHFLSWAIKIAVANPDIDLVLMDIRMPVMDGIEALNEIRNLAMKVPVVAQMAFAFEEEIQRIKSAGFEDFMTKPIAKEGLFDVLKKHLEN